MKQFNLFLFAILYVSVLTAQNETMYVMNDGNVVEQFNINTEIDSIIFYNPTTTSRLPDPESSMFPGLPNLLVTNSGQPVNDIATWESVRRPELLNIFRDSVYGRAPQPIDYTSNFSVASTTPIAGGTAVKKVINISITGPNGNLTFQAPLYIPNSPNKVPVVILINLLAAMPSDNSTTESFPLENVILPRGYAALVLPADASISDDDDGSIYRNGIINKFNLNGIYDWKVISAWAFAASRVIDYLVTDPNIDASKIITLGHSRAGKASLWTAAQDTRVALACVNNAGCTGDRLMRSSWQFGETITNINTSFPHWFATKYRDYNGRDLTLPFDFHQLVALVAPRLIAQGTASQDDWADPDAQFEGLVFAQPAFSLYGKTVTTWQVGDAPKKTASTVLRNGNIQTHQRIGIHELMIEDWNRYLDFADLKL